MRSNVRKERKKYEASIRSGTSPDFVYKPTLWYYEVFDFLKDQDTPRTSSSNMDDMEGCGSDEDTSEEIQESVADTQNMNEVLVNQDEGSLPANPIIPQTSATESTNQQHRPLTNSRPGVNKKKKNDELATDVLLSVRDHFKRPQGQENRYDLMGKPVAIRVRSLEKRQRLIAEKMINDILFEAEMGTLTTPSFDHTPRYIGLQERTTFTNCSGTPSPNSHTTCISPSPQYVDAPILHSVHNTTTGQTMMTHTPLYNTITNNSATLPTIIRKHITPGEEILQQINKSLPPYPSCSQQTATTCDC